MATLTVTPTLLDQGRSRLDRAYGHKTAQEVRHGPPQPPWDELPGMTFTRDMVGDLSPDELGRDDFSTDQRVRSYDFLMGAYELNRHRPVFPPIWQPPGLYILSGDQGDGKTLCAVDIGVLFVLCGWPSYSVNGGLCFGNVLQPYQVYAFAEYITRGSFGFGDEFHAIYGRYDGQTIRGRTMAQSTGGFRKEFIWFFGATSREWMLGADIKSAVRGIGYPFRDYPPGGEYVAPPWAYKGVQWYYPDPWRGNQYREIHDKEENHRDPCRKHKTYHFPPNLYRAGKHYVSWEKIQVDFGGKLGAEAFRNSLESDSYDAPAPSDRAIGMEVLTWHEEGEFDEAVEAYETAKEESHSPNRGGEFLLHLTDLAKRYQEKFGVKVSKTKMAAALREVGAKPSSRDRVPIISLEIALAEHKSQTAVAIYGG